MSTKPEKKVPSLLDALIPMLFLIGLLSLAVYIFGEDASWGPNQIALTFSSLLVAVIGLKNGYTWDDLGQGVVKSISQALPAIFILLAVGALIGTWVMSGTVTTMIYYGLKILSPEIFYPTVVIVTAIISASIGSSWTTVGTIGVGLIGLTGWICQWELLQVLLSAALILAINYHRFQTQPTLLLPLVVLTCNLYDHIKHMLWTTVPSLIISLIIFTIIGLNATATANFDIQQQTLNAIEDNFTTNLWLLFPVVAVIILAVLKLRPFPTILIGAVH